MLQLQWPPPFYIGSSKFIDAERKQLTPTFFTAETVTSAIDEVMALPATAICLAPADAPSAFNAAVM